MAGENCVIIDPSAANEDSLRLVHAISFAHGFTIQSKDSETRNHRVMYALYQKSPSFDITLKFSKHERYEDFSNWIMRYARRASDPNTIPVAMTVWIPIREFIHSGVPETTTFGRKNEDVTWTLNLRFTGVHDPISYSSPLLSRFEKIGQQTGRPLLDAPGNDVGQYFYPAGTQLTEEDRLAAEAEKRVRDGEIARPDLIGRGPR